MDNSKESIKEDSSSNKYIKSYEFFSKKSNFDEYMIEYLKKYEIVYEKILPNLLPNSKRTSLFFTDVLPLRNIQLSESVRNQHEELKYYNDGCQVPNLSQFYKVKSPEDHTLIFESRFECGNLCMAFKVKNK